ncbi:MAG: ABC transporter substrate-binding protein [Christensenellaceae bacterium]|nr:ABC transporter substrate-binding protein [Christensenellaceae bacterium]
MNVRRKYVRIKVLFFSLVILLNMLTVYGFKVNAATNDTVTFIDALDRKINIEKNPKRVAALIGSFADIWSLSGGSICATVEDAWEDFGLELPDAINIGGAHSPNLELLLSSNPDFVIASASTKSNVEMLQVLKAAGIAVAYFDVDNFYDYLAMLDICTDITGRKDLYEKNGLDIQGQIESIKSDFKKSNLPENERTVLLLRAHSGAVKAKGSQGTILGEMLADLGCINIADSDTSLLETLSIESIIKQEPYHIFVVTMGNDTEKAIKNLNQMMDENPAWGTLAAVAEGRLHLMDRKLFNIKPNARWAESYEKLSEIFFK